MIFVAFLDYRYADENIPLEHVEAHTINTTMWRAAC